MTPPVPDGPNRETRTIVGLGLMAVGAGVLVYAVVHTLRAGGTPGWALTVAFLVPLVLGALIAFTDQVGPLLKAALDRVTFSKTS